MPYNEDARDYCVHGDYVGGDPRICLELEADRAYLNAQQRSPEAEAFLAKPSDALLEALFAAYRADKERAR